MQHEEIRKLLRARPFVPFTVHLPEGRSVRVTNSEFALIGPQGRTMFVYDTDPDAPFNLFEVLLITRIEVGPPPAQSPAGSNTNGPAPA